MSEPFIHIHSHDLTIYPFRAFFTLSSSKIVFNVDVALPAGLLPSSASSSTTPKSINNKSLKALPEAVSNVVATAKDVARAVFTELIGSGVSLGFTLRPSEDGNWAEKAVNLVAPDVEAVEFIGKLWTGAEGSVEWSVRSYLAEGSVNLFSDHLRFSRGVLVFGTALPHFVLETDVTIVPRLEEPDNAMVFHARAMIANSSLIEFTAYSVNEWQFGIGAGKDLTVTKLALSIVVQNSKKPGQGFWNVQILGDLDIASTRLLAKISFGTGNRFTLLAAVEPEPLELTKLVEHIVPSDNTIGDLVHDVVGLAGISLRRG